MSENRNDNNAPARRPSGLIPETMGAVARDLAVMTGGSALYALSMVMFLIPSGVPVGGISGIAMVLNHLFGLPIGVMTIVLNVPLFLLSWRTLGRRFVVRSAYCMLLSSVLTDVFMLFVPVYEGDKLLSAMFGGAVIGISMGLIFSRGGTTGGTDIVSKLINFRTGRSVGGAQLACNAVVILAASYFYSNGTVSDVLEIVLYSVVRQAIASYALDAILGGMDSSSAAFIVTNKPEVVAEAIFDGLGRGVTAMDSQGMFSGKERTTLLCAVRSHESLALKRVVAAADSDSFMILTNAREVVGRGFKSADNR